MVNTRQGRRESTLRPWRVFSAPQTSPQRHSVCPQIHHSRSTRLLRHPRPSTRLRALQRLQGRSPRHWRSAHPCATLRPCYDQTWSRTLQRPTIRSPHQAASSPDKTIPSWERPVTPQKYHWGAQHALRRLQPWRGRLHQPGSRQSRKHRPLLSYLRHSPPPRHRHLRAAQSALTLPSQRSMPACSTTPSHSRRLIRPIICIARCSRGIASRVSACHG